MNKKSVTFFVTGTDTGVGKTLVSCLLLTKARQQDLDALGIKPVAAGGSEIDGKIRNEDALALQKLCCPRLAYEEVNPFCLKLAVAPHIAAVKEGIKVEVKTLVEHCRSIIDRQAGLTVIEGAGGWQVPINEKETFPDLVKALNIPVILVVGMRLGCLNHAMLSFRAMQADGVKTAGWVANQLEPQMPVYQENLESLQQMLPMPLLAEIPWQENIADIDLSSLAQLFPDELLS